MGAHLVRGHGRSPAVIPTIRVEGRPAEISAAAFAPPPPGIIQSRITTSGSSARAMLIASSVSDADPASSSPSSRSTIAASRARMSASSSATTTRMVFSPASTGMSLCPTAHDRCNVLSEIVSVIAGETSSTTDQQRRPERHRDHGEGATALVVVDMLNTYEHEDGERLASSVESTIEPIRKLVARARDEDVPVVYVQDNYGDWNTSAEKLAGRAMEGPPSRAGGADPAARGRRLRHQGAPQRLLPDVSRVPARPPADRAHRARRAGDRAVHPLQRARRIRPPLPGRGARPTASRTSTRTSATPPSSDGAQHARRGRRRRSAAPVEREQLIGHDDDRDRVERNRPPSRRASRQATRRRTRPPARGRSRLPSVHDRAAQQLGRNRRPRRRARSCRARARGCGAASRAPPFPRP